MPQKKLPETDDLERWVRPTKLNRHPAHVVAVPDIERDAGVVTGTVFVAVEYMRIAGLINLADDWLQKTRNADSKFEPIKRQLLWFYDRMRTQFEIDFASFVNQPGFYDMAFLRKRKIIRKRRRAQDDTASTAPEAPVATTPRYDAQPV